jgi:hypothetical protein
MKFPIIQLVNPNQLPVHAETRIGSTLTHTIAKNKSNMVVLAIMAEKDR